MSSRHRRQPPTETRRQRSRDITQARTSANRTYRHEALLWRDSEEFLGTALPFLTDGLEAGEAVMVATIEAHEGWLRDALGPQSEDVLFVDMAQLGRNPARIIPVWRQFLDQHAGPGAPVRGLGEPIWVGRRPEEVAEGQLHEALLNVAVEPDTPFWLLCSYDAGRLETEVIEEVYRSHPAIIDGTQYRGSHLYGGRDHLDLVFGSELAPLTGPFDELTFDRDGLQSVSSFVAIRAYAAGLGADKAADLAVAAHELANNTLHRGAPQGTIRIWVREDALICEVWDPVRVSDPMTGRKPTTNDQRKGLWVANHLCDLVQLRSTPDGTTVRVHQWI